MELDFENDMNIDQDALDIEWLEQAQLARGYGKYLADCQREVRRLEEKKKYIRSELIDYANRNPKEALGKDRPSDTSCEAFYRTQTEYTEVVEELNDAYYELEYAQYCYDQIAYTRKKSLENLVVLHGQQYFAGPKVPRDLSKEVAKRKEQNENANKTVGKKLKRKK